MKNLKKAKEILKELLGVMNISFEEIEINESENQEIPKINIKSEDSALLIGVRGANLFALNHLVKRIVFQNNNSPSPETLEEQTKEETKFFIDVNDYQIKLNEELKNKAKIMSERAKSFKVDVELDPMSAYERMIVHSALQNTQNIETESKGFGKDRRVVIRYVENAE